MPFANVISKLTLQLVNKQNTKSHGILEAVFS